MASHSRAKELAADPTNKLYWRFPMRRLTAEEVRDSILAVSGTLNPKAGGPSVFPPIPKEVLAGQSVPGQGWSTSPPAEAARRSVYVHVKRSLLVPIMATHDAADTDFSCPVRYTTTVPTQALGLLNGLSRLSFSVTDTSVQMIRNVPHLALIPLVIVWFGIEEGAKLFIVTRGQVNQTAQGNQQARAVSASPRSRLSSIGYRAKGRQRPHGEPVEPSSVGPTRS